MFSSKLDNPEIIVISSDQESIMNNKKITNAGKRKFAVKLKLFLSIIGIYWGKIFSRHPYIILMQICCTAGIICGLICTRIFVPARECEHYHIHAIIPLQTHDELPPPPIFSIYRIDFIDWCYYLPFFDDYRITTTLPKEDYFRQEIVLDLCSKSSRVNVIALPSTDVRNANFIHDFKENITAIVDLTYERCYLMSLQHSNFILPETLLTLIQEKTIESENSNMETIKINLRAFLPEITDLTNYSSLVSRVCYYRNVYKVKSIIELMEFTKSNTKITQGIHEKFTEYSGKSIIEYNLMNIKEIREWEYLQFQLKSKGIDITKDEVPL